MRSRTPSEVPAVSKPFPYIVLRGSRGIGYHFRDSAERDIRQNGGTLFLACDGARLNPDGSVSMPAGWSW